MPRPKPNLPKPEVKTFSDEQLHNALLYVEELFDRAGLPVMLWGETAHCVFNDELFGDRLQVATYKDSFNNFSTGVLQEYGHVQVEDMSNSGTASAIMKMEFQGVPIEVLALDRKARYVENPDSIRFRHINYLIPNPIKSYLAELVEAF